MDKLSDFQFDLCNWDSDQDQGSFLASRVLKLSFVFISQILLFVTFYITDLTETGYTKPEI